MGSAHDSEQAEVRESTQTVDIRESGIVPARKRGSQRAMPRAVTLHTARVGVRGFGASVASAGDLLLVGGRLEETQPFVTLYRVTDEGVVRERVLRGTALHSGPSLATDGVRIAVGQPAPEGGVGFVSIYRRRLGAEGQTELEQEATLELKTDDDSAANFGQLLSIDNELLVVGQPASISVYRHSQVGWLCAGMPKPNLPYEWNPRFGLSGVAFAGRVLIGNPVEIDGHRAGPGRVFVYRQDGDQLELEGELTGDGIEGGREEPNIGFGATITTSGEFVLITAPWELSPTGIAQSRVYVYRQLHGELTRVAALDVPACREVCMVGDKLYVLGDALHVFARQGNEFSEHATYAVNGASAGQVRMTGAGSLLALGYPHGHDEGELGQVVLHFSAQL